MRSDLALLLAAFLPAVATAQPATAGETALPASAGWHAFLVHQADGGVWYANVSEVVPAFGTPEVIATDDRGHLHVLSVYSGKWTPHSVNPDGQWLAPSRPADVDPRVPGEEIYAAGKAGNVHRITLEPRPFGKFALRSCEIGHAAGEEFHTVLAGDLAPRRPGAELWAFAISGALYELTAPDQGDAAEGDAFTMHKVAMLPGRVRDALLLPARDGSPARVLAVSRSGHLLLLRAGAGGVDHAVVLHEPMGLGRLARRAGADPAVVYVTRDDGVLLRLEEEAAGTWRRAVIFAGSQGLRGVAAGRFFAEPGREAVAVYGYGQRVQLVWRDGGSAWNVETIYPGPDQGHWLAVGELDGRNATDELIATGFGGKVVLLTRPAGYGLQGAAVEQDPPAAPRRPDRRHGWWW